MNGKMKVNKTVKFISENYNFCILLKMTDLKVAKSKRGINIIFEKYRYKINRKTQATYYLKCVRSCGAPMLANPQITQVIRPPGLYRHPEESEQIEYERIRQKMLKLANKDPTNVLKNIYDNVLEQHPSSIVPDYKSVRSSLYRKRSEKVPSVPKTISDIELRGRWRNSYARVRFLIHHNVGFWGNDFRHGRRNVSVIGMWQHTLQRETETFVKVGITRAIVKFNEIPRISGPPCDFLSNSNEKPKIKLLWPGEDFVPRPSRKNGETLTKEYKPRKLPWCWATVHWKIIGSICHTFARVFNFIEGLQEINCRN